MTAAPPDVPVLIAGGGPVGLTASILLSRLGVASLLVERRPGVTDHPRARSINLRSAEIFRGCGLEGALSEVSLPPAWLRQVIYTTTLAGPELGRMKTGGFSGESAVSPCRPLMSSQDRIEPLLRDAAERRPEATLRFGVELAGFETDAEGVAARLVERASGREERVRARFLVAADGAGSPAREALGIAMSGPRDLAHLMNTHFRADLSRFTEGRPAVLYWVAAEGVAGVLQPLDGRERWLCQIAYDPASEPAERYTHERAADWIRQAVGDPHLRVEVASVIPWAMSCAVAERFRDGRAFLAGDAAHLLPPTGGFGMNTGIQDVHNLAWKLAATLQGWSGEALLDSYESERAPVAHTNCRRSLENSRMVAQINAAALSRGAGAEATAAVERSRRYGNFLGMDLGFAYEKGALVPDGSEAPRIDDPVVDYAPTARPGHRAPHVPLVRDGDAISTLDLFGTHLCLLAGADGGAWLDAGRAIAGETPLVAYRVGPGGDLADPARAFGPVYGIEERGAVLVRPDGHVAWRSRDADAARSTLARAVAQVLCR